MLPATAVDLEANGLQLAKVRSALSLLVDLKQASGDHFDRHGGGLAVQDAIHESAHLRRRGVRFGRGRVALSAR